uniref:Flavin-containing monooxygenase n=1 Tax=Kalanchoe fedtschenkoi TaxID=63787 RepID=A0A7N1A5H0_KALFE
MVVEDVAVLIVGGGPSGLATAACLTNHSIPYVILEREDCNASLWRKHTYDSLKLHTPKEASALPLHPISDESPTYIPKAAFIDYIDAYVARFDIRPRCNRNVTKAEFDRELGKWRVEAAVGEGGVEVYVARFLVVASGENDVENVPEIEGLARFKGRVVHSRQYKNGVEYEGKRVLVVGAGNSGMEIAYDLSVSGARASVVVRSPIHILTKEMLMWGLKSYLTGVYTRPVVDIALMFMSRLKIGDLSRYGIRRPPKGPIQNRLATGRGSVLDVGTVAKIHSGDIKVFPAIEKICDNTVTFSDGSEQEFDAIILATGYKSGAPGWLKDYHSILNGDGTLKKKSPEQHWKGEDGVYCAGLVKQALYGCANDAQLIAGDIHMTLNK